MTTSREAYLHHALYYRDLLMQANEHFLLAGESEKLGLDLYLANEQNIRDSQRWTEKHVTEDDEAANCCETYPRVGANLLALHQPPRERIRWLLAAIIVTTRTKNVEAESRHIGNLASAFLELGNINQAIELYQSALSLVGERSWQLKADLLDLRGIAYGELGEFRLAKKFHRQALAIYRQAGHERDAGTCLGNLAVCYAQLNMPCRAIVMLRQYLKVMRETGDRRGEAAALVNLGSMFRRAGELNKSFHYLEQALSIHRSIGDQHAEPRTLGVLGNSYQTQGNFSKAAACYVREHEIATLMGDRVEQSAGLANLGVLLARIGRPRKAIEVYEKALALDRETGRRQHESTNLRNLGLAYSQLGDKNRALEFYREHLAIVREMRTLREEGRALWLLAQAFSDIHDLDQAIEHAEAAIQIVKVVDPAAAEIQEKQLLEWQAAKQEASYVAPAQ